MNPVLSVRRLVQCPASYVLVDPDPPAGTVWLPCPTCGRHVMLGGSPSVLRYEIHNEPEADR